MARTLSTELRKTLVQTAMGILLVDYGRWHYGKATHRRLSGEIYGRRHATSMSRHTRGGKDVSHAAWIFINEMSADAGCVLRAWRDVLDPQQPTVGLHGHFESALLQLGSSDTEIARHLVRETPRAPTGYNKNVEPVASFVQEVVHLRRIHHTGPVYWEFLRTFQTGVALLDCCTYFESVRHHARTLWNGVLAFAPSERDVLLYGDRDDLFSPSLHRERLPDEERCARYRAMLDFVPAFLEGRTPDWMPLSLKPALATIVPRLHAPPRAYKDDIAYLPLDDRKLVMLLSFAPKAGATFDEQLQEMHFSCEDADELWSRFIAFFQTKRPTAHMAAAFAQWESMSVAPRGRTFYGSLILLALKIMIKKHVKS